MDTLIEVIVGVITTIILGIGVRYFLNAIAKKPEPPNGLKKKDWEGIIERSSGGYWIGVFERLISLTSFWLEQYSLIGGWLAFKVATKWEVWKNIIQVPNKLNPVTPLNWYKARNALGSWIFTRYLVGTLTNVLIGLVATYVGSHFCEFLNWLYSRNIAP